MFSLKCTNGKTASTVKPLHAVKLFNVRSTLISVLISMEAKKCKLCAWKIMLQISSSI